MNTQLHHAVRRRAFIRFGTRCSASGDQTSYTYDALGTRKSKTVNGQTTLYLTAPVFGLSHVLMELNSDLSVKASYVYGGHQQLIEEPVATANSYTYEPFGARTPQTPATASRYGYTGEEYDAETGLVYLRARYYDPTLGRFISPDPFLGRLAEPITQNRYVYVKNNPLGFTDPSGKVALNVLGGGIGAVIGGVSGGMTVYLKGGSLGDIAAGTAIGAAGGVVSGFTFGAAGTLVVGGLASGFGNIAGQLVSGQKNINAGEVGLAVAAGGAGGVVSLGARAAGYGAVTEAGMGGLATAETQGLIDFGIALDKRFPSGHSRSFCPIK